MLLLLMYCLLLLPLFMRSVFGTCFVTKFHLSFCNHLVAGERAGCFTLIVFLVSCCCKCYVFLPLSAFGWSVVCDWKHFTHLLCNQACRLSHGIHVISNSFIKLIKLRQCVRFLTKWYVRPAKPQISLRIRAV